MTSLLLVSLASFGQLTLIDSVAIPVEMNGNYVRSAFWANAPNDSVVFSFSVFSEKEGDNVASLRYNATTKTISRLPGWNGFQKPCDDGIVTLYSLKKDPISRQRTTEYVVNYDVATGKELTRFDFQIERVGRLAVERYEPISDGPGNEMPRVFDVITGNELIKMGRYWDREGYLGHVAWDDGKLRLFASSLDESGKHREGIFLYRAVGSGFERGPGVKVHDYQLGFDRIIGNPHESYFAVEYSSSRWPYFTTLTKDFVKTPFQVEYVVDVSSHGVLGRMIAEEHEFGDPTLGKLGCWDPMNGKLLWQTDTEQNEKAVWLESYALTGTEIRNPKTGEIVATLPSDRIFVAARGQTIWLLTKQSPRQLEIYHFK